MNPALFIMYTKRTNHLSSTYATVLPQTDPLFWANFVPKMFPGTVAMIVVAVVVVVLLLLLVVLLLLLLLLMYNPQSKR